MARKGFELFSSLASSAVREDLLSDGGGKKVFFAGCDSQQCALHICLRNKSAEANEMGSRWAAIKRAICEKHMQWMAMRTGRACT